LMYREPPVWVLTLVDKRGILSSVCGTLSILSPRATCPSVGQGVAVRGGEGRNTGAPR
jgi:hypothetical protein